MSGADVQSQRRMHLHSKQNCTQEQKCLWEMKSKPAEDFWIWTEESLQRFVAREQEQEYNQSFNTYWWSCTLCCWMEMCYCTELYKLISFTVSMKRNTTYWSTDCLLLVPFDSTSHRFLHVGQISQLFHDPRTSWVLTTSCEQLVSEFMSLTQKQENKIPQKQIQLLNFWCTVFGKKKKKKSMCWPSTVIHYQVQLS